VIRIADNKLYFRKALRVLFCFFILAAKAQTDSVPPLVFDFNDHQIKEKNHRLPVKPVGISLTYDRFGNENSAIYLHGHPESYLNLGVSPVLKPQVGTISLWVNLDRKVYAGRGVEGNPLICTKNHFPEDFYTAYGMYYDLKNNRAGAIFHKDSTMEVNLMSHEQWQFNKWYHLLITISETHFAFYVNGELQQKAPKKYTIDYLETDSVVIGNGANTKNYRWSQGMFDDIMIFHRVLSDEEIRELYNAPDPQRSSHIWKEVLRYGAFLVVIAIVVWLLMRRNNRKLKRQREQLELVNRISELELKVVKAQMNPHFISNCLAAIQELIYQGDLDRAGQYIARFSFFLRQVLDHSDKNFITLAEELEMIELNVELEQLRFKEKFEFSLEVADGIDVQSVMVPSLLTQPFIENAIWHGLLPLKGSRQPRLTVRVSMVNGLPLIAIEDNGVGRAGAVPGSKRSKGTKLATDKIESLNRLTNTLNYRLQIDDLYDADEKPAGTSVKIQLDYITE